MNELHLIESTLFDQSGHCFSYTSSIVNANTENLFPIHVWLDKRGADLFTPEVCSSHLYFHRSLRRLQKILLYSKLLRNQCIIYICTAEFLDILILNFLQKIIKSKAQVLLHFHQFNHAHKKINRLRKIAQQNQSLHFVTPTDKLTNIFQTAGFTNCLTVACPSMPRAINHNSKTKKFTKVIYAGAARKDKGFPEIVALISHAKKIGINLAFALQVSTPSSGRHDNDTQVAINKLMALPKNDLILYKQTLELQQYQNLFCDAICLLIYDARQYHDKFSGVALDAFYAGCPIITVANTWMGDTVERFKAGITLENRNPENILRAINLIKQNYAYYVENAEYAASVLAAEHHPQNTLLAIKQLTVTNL